MSAREFEDPDQYLDSAEGPLQRMLREGEVGKRFSKSEMEGSESEDSKDKKRGTEDISSQS